MSRGGCGKTATMTHLSRSNSGFAQLLLLCELSNIIALRKPRPRGVPLPPGTALLLETRWELETQRLCPDEAHAAPGQTLSTCWDSPSNAVI